eukprot:TRINITY_DN5158_c0_g1_i2.p1 TRINITY_DN5158_c0_g1~~TRINITY_DN5158_c0_g1_i2.p1  ORF type:complete len:882 (+),score=144.48 TRINITY_DN5158_c0_g1_i2:104-2749(+)
MAAVALEAPWCDPPRGPKVSDFWPRQQHDFIEVAAAARRRVQADRGLATQQLLPEAMAVQQRGTSTATSTGGAVDLRRDAAAGSMTSVRTALELTWRPSPGFAPAAGPTGQPPQSLWSSPRKHTDDQLVPKTWDAAGLTGMAVASRLSHLARLFHAVQLIATPLAAWRKLAVAKLPKRRKERDLRRAMALRQLRLRAQAKKHKKRLPLIRLLIHHCGNRLHFGFARLRQPFLEYRENRALKKLMEIVHGRVATTMALRFYIRASLKRAFAGLWIWKSVSHQRHADARRHPPPSPYAAPGLQLIQKKTLRRWSQAVCMDLSRHDYDLELRRAAILSLVRSRTLTAIAFRQRVRSLLRSALTALQLQVQASSTVAAASKAVSSQRSRLRARRSSRLQSVADSETVGSTHLRGISKVEVLRKSWRRWRHTAMDAAFMEGTWEIDARARRPNVTEVLFSIAEQIEDAKNGYVSSTAGTLAPHGFGSGVRNVTQHPTALSQAVDGLLSASGDSYKDAGASAARQHGVHRGTAASSSVSRHRVDEYFDSGGLSGRLREQPPTDILWSTAAHQAGTSASALSARSDVLTSREASQPRHLNLLQRALDSFDNFGRSEAPSLRHQKDAPLENAAQATTPGKDVLFGSMDLWLDDLDADTRPPRPRAESSPQMRPGLQRRSAVAASRSGPGDPYGLSWDPPDTLWPSPRRTAPAVLFLDGVLSRAAEEEPLEFMASRASSTTRGHQQALLSGRTSLAAASPSDASGAAGALHPHTSVASSPTSAGEACARGVPAYTDDAAGEPASEDWTGGHVGAQRLSTLSDKRSQQPSDAEGAGPVVLADSELGFFGHHGIGQDYWALKRGMHTPPAAVLQPPLGTSTARWRGLGEHRQ